MGGWTIGHKIFADQLSTTANPNRVRFYVVTLFYEWLFFLLVSVGVRRSGASVFMVLGERWASVRQLLRALGIASGSWSVSAGLLLVFACAMPSAALRR